MESEIREEVAISSEEEVRNKNRKPWLVSGLIHLQTFHRGFAQLHASRLVILCLCDPINSSSDNNSNWSITHCLNGTVPVATQW